MSIIVLADFPDVGWSVILDRVSRGLFDCISSGHAVIVAEFLHSYRGRSSGQARVPREA